MRAVQQHNHAAYTTLVERHINGLHAYAYRYCQNLSDAQDITQETFLRVWNRANTWQPNRVQFSTWLFRITHNLSIDMFRKREANFEETAITDTALSYDETKVNNLARDFEQMLQQNRVRAAVYALPVRQRNAILLCTLQGFSNRQAAEILQLSVDALESLLARGRTSLKKTLSAENTTKISAINGAKP